MHRSLRGRGSAPWLVVVVASLPAGTVAAGVIEPIAQERRVDSFVIVPQCGGDAADGAAAKGFGPFEGAAEARLECETAGAVALAAQTSRIDPEALVASGHSTSRAEAVEQRVIHAIAGSDFDVVFAIDEACEYRIVGRITAAAGGDPLVLAGAAVRLTRSDGHEIVDRAVEPNGGERQSREIDEHGVLEPGEYSLRVFAGTVIDNEVPPGREADAAYEIALRLGDPCAADLDDDGEVGFGDLPAEGDCPADLNRDGTVGFADLLALLAAWGPC